MLAKETLVHRATSTSNFNTKQTSKHSKLTTSTQHKNLSSKSRSTAVNCMASIDRGLKKKGFLKTLEPSWQQVSVQELKKIIPVNSNNSLAGVVQGKLIPIQPL